MEISPIQGNALKNLGIEQLNTMQEECLLKSKTSENLVLISPTGTGKTLAFLFPLLDKIDLDKQRIQALVISPTRELALQIEKVAKGMQVGIRTTCCYGGHDVQTEMDRLAANPHIVIATPGRLCDHLTRRAIDLSECANIVLDEFDKCLEMGFEDQMKYVLDHLHTLKYRMLTSATKLHRIPEYVEFDNASYLDFTRDANDAIKIDSYFVDGFSSSKNQALFDLICQVQPKQAIVFCNERESVEGLADYLSQKSISAIAFHGGLEQHHRESRLCQFRNGSKSFLITTDLASRGLDIPDMECVIHFDLPLQRVQYVHRNGRTSRMGKSGKVYLIADKQDERPPFIEKGELENLKLKGGKIPEAPKWSTLFIGGGKKQKISKGDVLGFLTKAGQLKSDQIGLIEIYDQWCYAAIESSALPAVLRKSKDHKIKNQKLRFAEAR